MNHTSKDVVAAERSLARLCSDDLIAGVLNRNGLKTGRGNRWTRVPSMPLTVSVRRAASYGHAFFEAEPGHRQP